jgi:hypothetical protein
MNGLLPLTVKAMHDDGYVALSTSVGHEFRVPRSAVPESCPPGGCFMMDMDKVAEAAMPDEDRHVMARAVLNELLQAGTA